MQASTWQEKGWCMGGRMRDVITTVVIVGALLLAMEAVWTIAGSEFKAGAREPPSRQSEAMRKLMSRTP